MNKQLVVIKPQSKHGLHHWFMMACCLAMVVGIGLVVFAGSTEQSLMTRLISASPLLLCIGAHLVMHKFMGKTCHPKKENE